MIAIAVSAPAKGNLGAPAAQLFKIPEEGAAGHPQALSQIGGAARLGHRDDEAVGVRFAGAWEQGFLFGYCKL